MIRIISRYRRRGKSMLIRMTNRTMKMIRMRGSRQSKKRRNMMWLTYIYKIMCFNDTIYDGAVE